MALVGIAPPRRARGLPESTQREFDQWYEWLLRLQGFLGGVTGTTIDVSLTGNTHNLAPAGFDRAGYVRLSSSAAVNLTGVTSAYGFLSRKTLINVGSFNITLTHNDAGSLDGNKFKIQGGISLTLLPDDTCDIWYDKSNSSLVWRPI
jgi:hypothetical protein